MLKMYNLENYNYLVNYLFYLSLFGVRLFFQKERQLIFFIVTPILKTIHKWTK